MHRLSRKAARGVNRLKALVGSWHNDRKGVAAIEFGLIAPILLVMLLCVFELGRAHSMYRRFMNTGHMIGDLVTREQQVTPQNLQGIYRLVPTVMGGSSSNTDFSVEIIPLHINPAQPTQVRVYATPEAHNATKPSCGTPAIQVTEDEKKVLEGNSAGLILVTAKYKYKTMVGIPYLNDMDWEYRTTFSPRQNCISFGTGSAANSCINPCT